MRDAFDAAGSAAARARKPATSLCTDVTTKSCGRPAHEPPLAVRWRVCAAKGYYKHLGFRACIRRRVDNGAMRCSIGRCVCAALLSPARRAARLCTCNEQEGKGPGEGEGGRGCGGCSTAERGATGGWGGLV